MLWNWYTSRPPADAAGSNGKRMLPRVIGYLDAKYGDFEYAKDARALDTEGEFPRLFLNLLERARTAGPVGSVLVTGANSGVELDLLTGLEVTAFDLSGVALGRLAQLHPGIRAVQGDIQELDFPNKSFDLYVSMRSIHASNLDLAKSIAESVRVTKTAAIYSISNGYNIEGRLEKGMYDYDSGAIDTDLPLRIANEAVDQLAGHDCLCETFEVPSEILIFAQMQS